MGLAFLFCSLWYPTQGYSRYIINLKQPNKQKRKTTFLSFTVSVKKVVHRSRKEVFQPHLPVRLPCYDLAPVTGFTLGRALAVSVLQVPGFHGLTGGVYKARERIHRAMADARLQRIQLHGVELQTSIRTESGFKEISILSPGSNLCTPIVTRVSPRT